MQRARRGFPFLPPGQTPLSPPQPPTPPDHLPAPPPHGRGGRGPARGRRAEAVQEEYAWQAFGTGPAHGIQLRSGRLVVPVWLSKGTGGNAHRPSVVSTIYSDDAGKTWKRGEIVANETDPLTNPNESVLAQLADGRV